MIRFQILGPLRVLGAEGDLTPSAPKQRAVLALLVLRRNRTVQTSSFIDELWGDCPPESALPTLQTYIYKLRKMLDTARPGEGGRLLRTNGYSYQLDVGDRQSDLDEFEEHAEAGARALDMNDPARARAVLTEALGLWRGPALANVPAGGLLAAEVARLEERRLRVLEMRMDADLQMGRHQSLISELKALIMTHPLNETFYAKLMTSLARSGRPHEALDAYRRLQKTLRDELGLEPSAELRLLQRAILNSRPVPAPRPVVRLATAPPDDPPAPSAAPRPAQVPHPATELIGHDQLLTDLERWLGSPDHRHTEGKAVLLTGAPGVGKTSITLALAHRLSSRFPGGQLFAKLGGSSGQPAESYDVLVNLLRSVGALPPDGPEIGLGAATRLYREWCARRPVLVVLDDAASAWQVEPLMPGDARCGVLVTSRFAHALPGARTARVQPLRVNDCLRLLGGIIGRRRVDAEVDAAIEIVRMAGNLPLAVHGAAARLAASPMLSLRQFARRLSATTTRLGELSIGDIDLREGYRATYERLGEREQWAFRLLCLLGDREFSASEVGSLLGYPSLMAEMVLGRLVECHLLNMIETKGGRAHRYGFVGLARFYATECLATAIGQSADSLLPPPAFELSSRSDHLVG